MNRNFSLLASAFVVCGLSATWSFLRQASAQGQRQLVPVVAANGAANGQAAATKIDFLKDVHPLLQETCGNCHLNGKSKGGLKLDTRESVLKGGKSGPAAIVGNSSQSLMIQLVESRDPDHMMPLGGDPLTPGQIALLRAWVDEGLSFGVANGSAPKVDAKPTHRPMLAPRRVALPPLRAGIHNPIDRILAPYLAKPSVKAQAVVEDRVYARRVYLDIIGLLPSPAELTAFEQDKQADKRAKLAARVLADNENYAEHWLSFWNDALRNDYAGTGYIDGGRQQITGWLYKALLTNKPYDQFVRELIDTSPQSEGFTRGIVWRGTVNASQTVPMQAAQNVSQVFLGINLKCASCHDSFISDWKLSDAYALAGVWAESPLEMMRCDKPTGKIAPIQFLYPQLGAIDGAAPKATRLKQLASVMTSKKNGRLSRTVVNRVWARLMGRGLIEPTDEMDNVPWSADLLDWLAADFADNGYDLKRLMRLIVSSRAYQMPSVGAQSERDTNFRFAGPLVRRLSAEQFTDAISALTDVWSQNAAVPLQSTLTPRIAANWIWNNDKAAQAVAGGRVFFRKRVTLQQKPTQAMAVMSCDNQSTLWVNGQRVGDNEDWKKPSVLDLAPFLKIGTNVLAVEATNWPDAATKRGLSVTGPSAAGLVLAARIRFAQAPPLQISSDNSWLAWDAEVKNWQQPQFSDATWKAAVELGDADAAPWKLQTRLAELLQQSASSRKVRSSLTTANALTTALGRPNREQVVTVRPTAATTLQSLELSNGQTLSRQIQQGAALWISESPTSSRDLVEGIWARSLGRRPTTSEMQTAQAIVGTTPRVEGVEDLLWIVAMLPEFQLIY